MQVQEVPYTETEYPRLRARKSVPLSQALFQLVRGNGVGIFTNPEELRDSLHNRNVSEIEVAQAYLFSQAGGFRNLMLSRETIEKQELDRFVSDAVRETGLRRDTVLKLTQIFLSASGRRLCFSFPMRDDASMTVYPIPRFMYNTELRVFRKALQHWRESGTDIPEDTLAMLQPWLAAGLPEAQSLMGDYLLSRFLRDPSTKGAEQGVKLLKEAVNSGDSLAAAALGDYYYEFRQPAYWKTAVRYYTGYGSPALTKVRRDRLISLLDIKQRNGHYIRFCFCLLCFFLFLFGPIGWLPIFPVSLVSFSAILVEFGIFLFAVMRWNFGNPYIKFYRVVPPLMILVGLFFLAERFLSF